MGIGRDSGYNLHDAVLLEGQGHGSVATLAQPEILGFCSGAGESSIWFQAKQGSFSQGVKRDSACRVEALAKHKRATASATTMSRSKKGAVWRCLTQCSWIYRAEPATRAAHIPADLRRTAFFVPALKQLTSTNHLRGTLPGDAALFLGHPPLA